MAAHEARADFLARELIEKFLLIGDREMRVARLGRGHFQLGINGVLGGIDEMAVRLSKAFGSSPEVWLGLQMEYDLAQVEKDAHNIKVKRVA